jgi:putative transposase
METSLRVELVFNALNMALKQRRPSRVIHHSDQGSQYTSLVFGQRCEDAGVRPAMGAVGDCFDNAMCESFFATLEREFLNRHRLKTPAEARSLIFEFIEGWHNPIAVIRGSTICHRRILGSRSAQALLPQPHTLY